MILADAWYNLPAWGFIGVVGGLIGTAIAIVAAFRAATPKLLLQYGLASSTPLVANKDLDLTLLRNGSSLADPYVATLVLAIGGRQDITEDHFSKGRPLALDLGVRVLEVLDLKCAPADIPMPAVVASGTKIEIGPDLLPRRSLMRISVLLDGGAPTLALPERTLADVQLRRRQATQEPDETRFVLSTTMGSASTWLATYLTTRYAMPYLGPKWSWVSAIYVPVLLISSLGPWLYRISRDRIWRDME